MKPPISTNLLRVSKWTEHCLEKGEKSIQIPFGSSSLGKSTAPDETKLFLRKPSPQPRRLWHHFTTRGRGRRLRPSHHAPKNGINFIFPLLIPKQQFPKCREPEGMCLAPPHREFWGAKLRFIFSSIEL